MRHEVFFDDFQDGIWTKHVANPVIVRNQPWAESHYLCEPNIVYADGLFRMWFSQMFPAKIGMVATRFLLGSATGSTPGTARRCPGRCESSAAAVRIW